jgi:hypothetical protein
MNHKNECTGHLLEDKEESEQNAVGKGKGRAEIVAFAEYEN